MHTNFFRRFVQIFGFSLRGVFQLLKKTGG